MLCVALSRRFARRTHAEDLFKFLSRLHRGDLPYWANSREKGVFNARTGMPQSAARADGVNVLCLENFLLVDRADGALLRHQEAGTHLHAHRAQHERCRQLTSIRDAARRDHRDLHRVAHLRDKRHGRELTDVSAAFATFCDHRSCAALLNQLCNAHRSHQLGRL